MRLLHCLLALFAFSNFLALEHSIGSHAMCINCACRCANLCTPVKDPTQDHPGAPRWPQETPKRPPRRAQEAHLELRGTLLGIGPVWRVNVGGLACCLCCLDFVS